MSTVVLVSDNENIKTSVKRNLVLLRNSDKFVSVNGFNAQETLLTMQPDVVIFHCDGTNRQEILTAIKTLKENVIFNAVLILLLDKPCREFVIEAFDYGVDDYCTVSDDFSELVIRVLNAVKKSDLKSKLQELKGQMSLFNILDAGGNFYTNAVSEEILARELQKENCGEKLSYIITGPDEEGKKFYSDRLMSKVILKSVRGTDLVFEKQGGKFAILLRGGVETAITVFEKIKLALPKEMTVKAGILSVCDKKADEIGQKASSAFNSALLENCDYKIYLEKETSSDDWLREEVRFEGEKTFKLFKNVFKQKINNVISPVFYRFQKAYEDKFDGVKVAQFANEYESIFRVSDDKNESRLTIISPKFSKVILAVTHSGLESPENSTKELPLNQVTVNGISEITEEFIQDFLRRNQYI